MNRGGRVGEAGKSLANEGVVEKKNVVSTARGP